MYKLYCRVHQWIFRVAMYLLPWRRPQLLEGANSVRGLPALIKEKGIRRVLVVTDSGIVALGLMDELLQGLAQEGIEYAVYDKTVPNPTIDNIQEALQEYKDNECQGIVAFGGGSAMDCAKGVGARVVRPQKNLPQMKGQFKILKTLPPLFAVPTTAGTGSEATVTSVVANSRTHEKYPINDISLIPHYAVLDPLLTVGLPPQLTATTGMDALTHAVEAYIGKSNTTQTWKDAREAVKLIFANLHLAYLHGDNIQARASMQRAAYLAGCAFTRAYVGYVHAIAHTLGGFYSVPHGLANAVILPICLEYYGEAVHKPLAELADLVGIAAYTETEAEKAQKFIDKIKELNQSMNIPEKISGIKDEDIPLMVRRALQEANPLYPVPKIYGAQDLTNLYNLVKG